MKFSEFFLRIVDFEKPIFFESAILEFVLLHPHENQSKLLGYQGWVEILKITLVYSKRVSVRNNLLHSVSKYVLTRETLVLTSFNAVNTQLDLRLLNIHTYKYFLNDLKKTIISFRQLKYL